MNLDIPTSYKTYINNNKKKIETSLNQLYISHIYIGREIHDFSEIIVRNL